MADTAAQKKAKAAQAEQDKKKITFRDLELQLPEELPTAILFDVVELEADANDPLPLFRLLRALVGPDQFTDVRNQIADDEDVFDSLDELVKAALAPYGMSLGE